MENGRRWGAVASAALAGIAILLGSKAHSQTEQDAATVMRLIAREWRSAISDGRWYVKHCAENTYAMERFSPVTTVAVDAQRSNSVMSPFLGIVELTGSFETNEESPAADGFTLEFGGPGRPVCFHTVAEAKAAISASDISPRGSGNSFTIRATYAISPEGARLTGGNEFFDNVLSNPLSLPENRQAWGAVVFKPLTRGVAP